MDYVTCILQSPGASVALFETFYRTSRSGAGRETDHWDRCRAGTRLLLQVKLRGRRGEISLPCFGSSDVLGPVGILFEIYINFHVVGV